jgi:hypothetical protein
LDSKFFKINYEYLRPKNNIKKKDVRKMGLENFVETLHFWYLVFIEWYMIQPIYGQILAIIGVFSILALTVVLVFYLIKGIAYLIYYILKGVYYILKGIGLGVFKLCEGFYKIVSGKLLPSKHSQSGDFRRITNSGMNDSRSFYCSECGQRSTERMINRMRSVGLSYCINCGKKNEVSKFQESPTLIYQYSSNQKK